MKTQLDTKNNINIEHLFKLDSDRVSGKTFGSKKPEFLATSLQHFAGISILFIRAVVRTRWIQIFNVVFTNRPRWCPESKFFSAAMGNGSRQGVQNCGRFF